eukprot:SAG11_NODE_781_length_7193_cov_25.713561_3_plen_75_part_00
MIIPIIIETDPDTGVMELITTESLLGSNGRRMQGEGGAEVQQFRCECGSGSISACVPECQEVSAKYQESITTSI